MLSTEKGFSLWEMLVCILFLSLMCLVTLRFKGYKAPDHYYFLNEYMLAQSEAIKEKQGSSFEKGIYFNSMGHINMARTVEFENQKVTLNLGTGYALIK